MTDLDPAAINAKAYRAYLKRHPRDEQITLTRAQMEAIIRDLEALAAAEARIVALEHDVRVLRLAARVREIGDAMSAHVPTAHPRVRYQIAGGPYGYHVTRCRYDGTRWMLQLAYRVAAPTYEQARGIAARLAATERGAN